jgi:two-component system nitrate/nitrite response regulator NarL
VSGTSPEQDHIGAASGGPGGSRSAARRVEAPIRVHFLTDVRLYAEGLGQILDRDPGIHVTGSSATAREAVAALTSDPADVVLVDLPPPDGPEVVRAMREAAPGTRVVALAVPEADDEVIAWAEAGIEGFLPRDGSLAGLMDIIRSVDRGETICSPRVAATLLRRVADMADAGRSPVPKPHPRLTSREMQIVRLIGRGLSNKEIARALRIALPTVKNHIHHVLEKLHVRRRWEAASLVLDRSSGMRMDLGY